MRRESSDTVEWPELLADPDGDRERELARAYRLAVAWRAASLFLAAVIVALCLLYAFGVL